MTTARQIQASSDANAIAVLWVNRGLEGLWLLSAILVPLAFLAKGYAVSEAEIANFEVPKVALLRTLAAAMAVLWLIEWAIGTKTPINSTSENLRIRLRISAWLPHLGSWLREKPTRWVLLAVWFYLATILLSTVLSASLKISLWGEIPGQDGYSAYTVISYILVFGTVVTHLKTRAQLWRLLHAVVAVGVLVAGYGMFQHYGYDFLDLTEETGGGTRRITAFMGNAIFAAAVMCMTIPVSLATGTASLSGLVWTRDRLQANRGELMSALLLMSLWSFVLAVQLLGFAFTLSRGPWIGTSVALTAFLGLGAIFAGWRVFGRAALLLGLAAALTLGFLQSLGSISLMGLGPWLGPVIVLAGAFGSTVTLVNWRNLAKPILIVGLAASVGAAIVLGPSLLTGDDGATIGAADRSSVNKDPTASQVTSRLASIQSEVLGGFTSGRATHWKVSWRLIRERPWFEFDSLSFPWLRPLIGYGPDLFRFTYLLESPAEGAGFVPLEPDHAHNYFIHHMVEQGFLGLLSSFGLFLVLFFVASYQLSRHRRGFSLNHKLILIGLLATMAGRFVEMMVGVARISDLMILWVILAMFAALPAAMQHANKEEALPTPPRSRRPGTSRPADGPSAASKIDWRMFWRLAIVAWLISGIGIFTWVKSINNVRAAVVTGEGVEHFRIGDFQSTLAALDRATDLAPGISRYYDYKSQVYLSYRLYDGILPEPGCTLQDEIPYNVCLGIKALESNLEGVAQSPFYYRSSWALANAAFNLKLEDEAIRFYQQSLELLPSSWQLRNELASVYLESGQPQAALESIEKSLAVTKDSPLSGRALVMRGLVYRELGDPAEAARWLEAGLALDYRSEYVPRAIEVLEQVYSGLGNRLTIEHLTDAIAENADTPLRYFLRGRVYLGLDQPEQAIEDFSRSMALGLETAELFSARGKAMLAVGNEDQARRDMHGAINRAPGNVVYQLDLAKFYLLIGGLQTAMDLSEESLRLDPDLAEGHRILGLVYLNQSQPLKSIDEFNEAIRLEPTLANAYNSRGLAKMKLGQIQLAAQDFDEAIRLDPRRIVFFQNRGQVYFASRQYRKAIQDYSQIVLLNPQNALAYIRRGLAHFQLGQFDRTMEDYYAVYFLQEEVNLDILQLEQTVQNLSELLRVKPQPPEAYALRGMLYFFLGQHQRAIQDLNLAVQLDQPYAKYYVIRGKSYDNLGQHQQAVQDYGKAIALNPGDVSAYNGRALAYSQMGRFERAIQDYDQVIRLDSAFASTYNGRALAYIQTGETERAIQDFDQAINLSPKSAEFYVNRAFAHEVLNKDAEARLDFERAIQLGFKIASQGQD